MRENPVRSLVLVALVLLCGVGGSWFYSSAQQKRQPQPPPVVSPQEYQKIYADAVKVGLVVPAHESPAVEPTVVTPGATPGAAPSDAVVLFDGKDLSQWWSVRTGEQAMWELHHSEFCQ